MLCQGSMVPTASVCMETLCLGDTQEITHGVVDASAEAFRKSLVNRREVAEQSAEAVGYGCRDSFFLLLLSLGVAFLSTRSGSKRKPAISWLPHVETNIFEYSKSNRVWE